MSNRKRDSRKRKMARRLRNRTRERAAKRRINEFENNAISANNAELEKLEKQVWNAMKDMKENYA